MLEALLAAMMALAPGEPEGRLRALAAAIERAEPTREEAAVLVTIDLHETYFERRGIPFGLVSWRRRIAGQGVDYAARTALAVYRLTRRCGTHVAARLGWYHTGHCRSDAFSRREARVVQRVLARLPRENHP